MSRRHRPFRLAVICGGPSPERGISLNSARSLSDHLHEEGVIEVVPVYVTRNRKHYLISRYNLYSNTPADFDFKLASLASPLTKKGLTEALLGCDLVFPAMHGEYGEDGELQRFLEGAKIPFVGSPSSVCAQCYDKGEAIAAMERAGFHRPPAIVVDRAHRGWEEIISSGWASLQSRRVIIKPARGGSSLGIVSTQGRHATIEALRKMREYGGIARYVIEPYLEGSEFTAVVIENRAGLPVSLPPIEIEKHVDQSAIFSYRQKYLPSQEVTYHCPPRFSRSTTERVQRDVEELARRVGLRDVARIDGWVLTDGSVVLSDVNPVSGMEQNSFLFIQASRIGLSHADLLRRIVHHACERQGITPPSPSRTGQLHRRKQLRVLFGGDSAERQVSVMSGTNVWLKLRRSRKVDPRPFLLDTRGKVWSLPYSFALNHTVEEIEALCRRAPTLLKRLAPLVRRARERLDITPEECSAPMGIPEEVTVSRFLKSRVPVFLALHGGRGEDGTLQRQLERARIPFNGSGSECSALCMDKFRTGMAVMALGIDGVGTARKEILTAEHLFGLSPRRLRDLYRDLQRRLGARSGSLIVKPNSDGSSAGVVRVTSFAEFALYVKLLSKRSPRIPGRVFTHHLEPVELPPQLPREVLVEECIETDRISVEGGRLSWRPRTGWIEVTVGLVGPLGRMRALTPSLTIAHGGVLSLEEKFQGGTGINITPPPRVSPEVLGTVRARLEAVARGLGLSGYARVDAFIEIERGGVLLIEVNTLPALTPSTVLFHQGLVETPPLPPREFLERLVKVSS